MLLSFSVLQKAVENYKEKEGKESENEEYSVLDSASGGLVAGFLTGFVIVALIFVALELLVMVFALQVAIRCTSPGPERIVHLVMAVVFTLPYMLLSLLFNKCAVATLKGVNTVNTEYIHTVNV